MLLIYKYFIKIQRLYIILKMFLIYEYFLIIQYLFLQNMIKLAHLLVQSN